MLRPTSPRRLHRLRDGGFTLIELLGVLAMISLLVVLASPTFVRVMRDRRVARAAMQLVDYYRTARTAAIGRGQPMLVAYNASGNAATHPGGTGRITMMEPIVTTMQAATTCNTTNWGDTTKVQTTATFDVQNGFYDYTYITPYDDAGTKTQYMEICFSNTGRMWLREGGAPPLNTAFHLVTGVPTFSVLNIDQSKNIQQGPPRTVFVPPNGMARLQL